MEAPYPSPRKSRPRVSPDHTLNRVRENQRRHRARRRDYIATLEQQLQESERRLAEARAEIEALKRERDGHRSGSNSNSKRAEGMEDKQTPTATQEEYERLRAELTSYEAVLIETASTPVDDSETQQPLSTLMSFSTTTTTATTPTLPRSHPTALPLPLPLLDPSVSLLPGPSFLPDLSSLPSTTPPCCATETSQVPSPENAIDIPPALTLTTPNPECPSCSTRPPPSPNESTTLCSQAYVLIAQQNFRGLDAFTIRTWLVQGFRAARQRGEGCRVENTALFRLLDFISGM